MHFFRRNSMTYRELATNSLALLLEGHSPRTSQKSCKRS